MEIRVNLEEIEHLAQKLRRIVMDTDDILLRIRMLRSEMEEDSALALLPDSVAVLDMLDGALNSVTRIHETAVQLQTLVEKAPELFREQENLFTRRISELSTQLDILGTKMNTAMNSEQIVVEDHSRITHDAEILEHVIIGAPVTLAISDVSPVKKSVNEIFPVRKVIDME